MEFLTSFLISVLANIATDKGKELLNKFFKNNTLAKKIEEAFDRALQKWSINKGVRENEVTNLSERTTLLSEIIRHQKSPENIDKNILELIGLFKIEIMSDPIAYNFLIELRLQEFFVRFKKVEDKLDTLPKQLADYLELDAVDIQALKLAFSSVQEAPELNLSNSHFIEDLKKEFFYIPRQLINHTEINKSEAVFFGRKNDDDIELVSLIKEKSRIVVLGSAGTGKSTELKEAAILISESKEFYPIYLPLSIYTTDKDIDDLFLEEWTKIPQSKVVVFLDGLDEIEETKFNDTKRKIIQFIAKYKETKVVVSCRTNFYDLPVNEDGGTLGGFDVYYLQELTQQNVINYVNENYDFDGVDFMIEVNKNKLIDLVFNPFFLKLLLSFYTINNKNLSGKRSEMFKQFIESRFQFDKEHYSYTVDLRNKKNRVFEILRRVSISMEIVGVRNINHDILQYLVPEEDDIKLISHGTVFNKVEGNLNYWRFEHNYFQEFLSAELLAKQDFETVKSIISHEGYDKVLPTWHNTVGQLISILEVTDELFKELTLWLINNDIEVLINVEKEKLPLDRRFIIFKKIFGYYKRKKIWLSSNKFSNSDLAYFAHSNDSISYLLRQINDGNNNRITRLSALYLLCDFDLSNYDKKASAKSILIDQLNKNNSDAYFTSKIIDAINSFAFYSLQIVNKVYNIVENREHQYIRTSMYEYLIKTEDFEKYIDYYLDGFKLLRNGSDDRENFTYASESRLLKDGIKKFKSPESIRKIINSLLMGGQIEYNTGDGNLLKDIIENSVIAYNEAPDIYDFYYKLLEEYHYFWVYKSDRYIVDFFEKTNTKERAISQLIESFNSSKNINFYSNLISLFIGQSNFLIFINLYNENKISSDLLISLYWNFNHSNPKLAEEFKNLIQRGTDCVIIEPEKIDWDAKRNAKLQKSFDLLFDLSGLIDECIRVFGDNEKLEPQELWKLNEGNFKGENFEYKFIDTAFHLVLDFSKNKKTKTDLLSWLNESKNYERYMIEESCQYLMNHKELNVSDPQKQQLKEWYLLYIGSIDFNNVLKKKEDHSFLRNNYASYLSFLIKRFGFECSEKVLLDMLLFSLGNTIDAEMLSFDEIINKIGDKEKVNIRVTENIIRRRIFLIPIYESHIQYVFENKLEKVYPEIIEDIISLDFGEYDKTRIVDFYIEYLGDISVFKKVFEKLSFVLKLHIIEKLIASKEFEFVSKKLLEMRQSEHDDQELLNRIDNYLINAGNINGLKFSIDWIKQNKYCKFSRSRHGLANFSDIEALPYFIELLELSYDESIKTEHEIERMWSIVVEGIEYLAVASETNHKRVIIRLKKFIKDNKGKLDDVEFLNTVIERINEEFYKSFAPKYDFLKAKEIVEKIID